MQGTRLAIIIKKREIKNKNFYQQRPELHEDFVGLKRVELINSGKTSLQIKFLNVAKKVQSRDHIQRSSFLYYISDEGRYIKTANTSVLFRASISGIIRRVSCTVTTVLRPKLIRLPTIEEEVQKLTDRFLNYTHCTEIEVFH